MCACCGVYTSQTCGMNLATTDAGCSPGTHHNMPGELQARIQLSDHTLGGQHISRHLPFSGADTKNVVASISVAGTSNEVGIWWPKMPGDQTEALRTSQQQWSRESTTRSKPTLGDASYTGAIESGHGMTEGHNYIRRCSIVLRTFREENGSLCCFCYLRKCRGLKPLIHGHLSICEADQEKMSDWKTHSYTKFLYVPEVIWAQISKVSHMFLEVITTEASHGLLAGAWRSSTSVNVVCISNCKHVIPRSKITYGGICKACF